MRPTIFLMRGRFPQNENKVPFKVQMPLALRNRVTGKNSRTAERGCLFELSMVLSCLDQNNYENKQCLKEVDTFQNCYKTYLSNLETSKKQARQGILTPNTKNLKYNQLNILLRKYPHV
ncbi:uncharacterized protein [Venturia canescens]|uniref:uncharacterized protein n=1 Tax=Venturia canescens TaxID=32260 RepID=UPI001C9C403B|nr:uncharacterized protein LOC122413965 [Venturia canescens]